MKEDATSTTKKNFNDDEGRTELRAMEESLRQDSGKSGVSTSQTSSTSSSSATTSSGSNNKNGGHNTTDTKSDTSMMQEFNQRAEFVKAAEKAARDNADMMMNSPASHPSETGNPQGSGFMQEFNDRADFAKAAEKAARDNATVMNAAAASLPSQNPMETTGTAATAATPTRAQTRANSKSGMLVLNPLSAQKKPGAFTATGRMETVDYENAFNNTPAPNSTPPPLVSREEQERNDRLAAAAASAMMGDVENQEQPRESPVVALEEDYDDNNPTSKIWWKRKPVMLATMLLVIIAIVVPILIVLQSNSSSESETVEQQQEIEEKPIEEKWIPLVPNMTNSTIMALENPLSQQAQAYEWIGKDPDWDSYEDWRKQQRFAMMCLFYAYRGIGLVSRFRPLYDTHECDWLPSFGSCRENDDGEIERIGVSGHIAMTFHGTMPPEIAFLPNLKHIHFSGNLDIRHLEDLFPLDTIISLPPVKSLTVDGCNMGGSIPSTLGLMSSLTSLDLPDTDLMSTIPSQLGYLSDLETLTLSSNKLTGSIPKQIGELSSLINFDIRTNPDLEQPIPSGFCMDGRVSFESLITDWCFSPAECCSS